MQRGARYVREGGHGHGSSIICYFCPIPARPANVMAMAKTDPPRLHLAASAPPCSDGHSLIPAPPSPAGYPGGPFDPLGLASGSKESVADWRLKEIKNARLAMMAFLGFIAQHAATGKGPIDNLFDVSAAEGGEGSASSGSGGQGTPVYARANGGGRTLHPTPPDPELILASVHLPSSAHRRPLPQQLCGERSLPALLPLSHSSAAIW